MEELIERLVVVGYSYTDAETLVDLFASNAGYNAAREFVIEKEKELYV